MEGFKDLICELGRTSKPLSLLRELEWSLMHDGNISDYLAADNLLDHADLSGLPLKPIRIYFLRSATIEQLIPILRVKCLLAGINAEIGMGPYGQYQQEILDPNSQLYHFLPDVVILAVRLVDVAPALFYDYTALSSQQIANLNTQVLSTFQMLLSQLRKRLNATILVHNFETPAIPSYGIFDYQDTGGQIRAIRDLNDSLREICRSFPGVYVFGYDELSSRYGKLNWIDSRMWHMARIPVNPHQLSHLADEYLRYLIHLTGLTRKCLILDMDGTLWGGIIGEDGIGGIKLGNTYPGSAYVDFQHAVLNLYRRGIILGICSKNEPDIALEVLDSHPDMVLRREHFASMRINWRDKATNIQEIVQELNIGMDSVVFLDDNPVEVARVRDALPEVLAYQMPAQPENFVAFLQSLPVFDTLTITADDRRRGEEYRQQAARRVLQSESASLEDFYRRLEMKATIAKANDMTLPRIAQLTQKTNQFNLTTRRYTEQDLRERIASGEWHVYSLELEDRFGENGLVAVGILRANGDMIWIDSLLMSCRVMGRTVEQTFVYYLAMEARRLGFDRLMAEYIPTRKNGVVADLYPSLGFVQVAPCVNAEQVAAAAADEIGADAAIIPGQKLKGATGSTSSDGRTVWCLDLADLTLSPSPFVAVLNDADVSN
ncbi:MAG: HAD-IIIC family phosphatase [Firmicutes bacterium]|nr:HAD-IIIC family phosphatase [Bacillota bacterium]